MKLFSTLKEIRTAIEGGDLLLPELLEYYFSKIKENEHLNAFNEVFFHSARVQAEVVQNKIINQTAGKLAGMVIGIKDNICYINHEVTASSAMLQGFIAPYSATVIEKLIAEDAVIIGRLNCDEFAMGGSNETSYYGPVLNYADSSRVSGGSSGGSAVAVQADMCLAALGTDTGGSVRQPAAFTGLVGIKPTYGRISRYGVIAYASSFDQIGTFTKTVEDGALLIQILAGHDPKDSTSSDCPYFKESGTVNKVKKIAVIEEMITSKALDAEIKQALLSQIDQLKKEGNIVEYVSFDLLDYLVPTYYILTTAEASSNLNRYDGVRFGHRTEQSENLNELYRNSRAEGFGEEVKRRILLGTFVLSAGYYDAYYQKAQKVRRLITEKLEGIFSNYDFILTPVTPTPAFKVNELNKDPLVMYMADIFTVLANLGGCPAISLPLGVNVDNLPIAYQLIADKFEEASLCDFAEQVTKNILSS